jgi:asparagine synthase (glutamine-hydrolysing)
MGITVGVKGKESLDIKYSKIVANELEIENHHVFYVEPQKVKDMVETAVKILKSFNPEWVSSTTTLLLGTLYAKKNGAKSISSGEGADDLFGSFPFFKNWKGDYKSLDNAIKDRLNEIVIMSNLIAQSMNMQYIAPFHDDRVRQEILSIPIEERMKKSREIETKYPLRKSYEGILPQICITRPQTMAFTGSGIYDTIRSIGDEILDEDFLEACQNILPFKNKFEYALFKIYRKKFEFNQKEHGGCIHCGSDMGNNKINCRVCATLQVDGKELAFDGEDR